MNAPETAVAVASLPLAHITPSPSNPRKHFDETYLAELAGTIKDHGVLQPITVRPNPRHKAGKPIYEIVVGECRWRAAKIAGLTEIPAFWRELDDRQVLEIQIVENLQRRDVHPLEEAEGYEQLMKLHGYKAEQLADKIGKSRAYIYARLKLIDLAKDWREAFFAGKLDASTALLVARIPASLQKKAVKAIVEHHTGEPMSYRAARQYIRSNFTLSLKQATFSLQDAKLVPAAGACSACPKRSGNNPDLFGDIDDADVCTDPKCFEEKRLARHAQLIAEAEKHEIPVLRGADAKKVMPNGLWSLDEDRYVSLQDAPEGDPEERSYREILGKAAPVAALIEYGPDSDKRLLEVAEPKALAAALKKAGWKPQEQEEKPDDPAEAAKRAEWEDTQKERARVKAAAETESARRAALFERVFAQFRIESLTVYTPADMERLLRLFAEAFLRREIEEQMGIDDEDLLTRWGLPLPPAEYDHDEEADKLIAALRDWRIGDVFGFLFDWLSYTERNVAGYNYDPEARPAMLNGLIDFFGIGTLPAEGDGANAAAPAKKTKPAKKPKTTLNPAAAWPMQNHGGAATDAAPAPQESTLTKTTWPFPTGSRPA